MASYRLIDATVGRVADALHRRGDYDDTLIVICSDHGHSPVHEHYDLPVRLERDHRLRVAYHSWPVMRRDPEAVACVSGNGMCQVYVRSSDGWRREPARAEIATLHPGLLERLVAEPAIDVVITRADEGDGWLNVESRDGRARLRETPDGAIEYEPEPGTDPLGLPGDLPRRLTAEEALAATFDSRHPDGLMQIAQLYRSSRAGDITVSATPGYDLRERYERPEHHSAHGSLDTMHMRTPLAISAPVDDGPIRTADVFATTLEWLGREAPHGIDGRSRLVAAQAAVARR